MGCREGSAAGKPKVYSETPLQALSVTMWAFGKLRLYIQPPLAEMLINTFHQGIVEGAMEHPQAISNVLWACASLGYAPSAMTLQDLKVVLRCCIHGKMAGYAQDCACQCHRPCCHLPSCLPMHTLCNNHTMLSNAEFRWSPNWQDALDLHLA